MGKVLSHEWGLHQPDKHIRIKIYIYIYINIYKYTRQIYCTLNDLNVFFLYDFNWSPPETIQISGAAISLNQILLDDFVNIAYQESVPGTALHFTTSRK